MIHRLVENRALDLATKFPAISITGPRQSGKTTLARQAFPSYDFVSFEDPENRDLFERDPRSFLARYRSHVIFDEAQRVPELLSYLQGIIDEDDEPGSFVITGSQNFLLLNMVSQSLAG